MRLAISSLAFLLTAPAIAQVGAIPGVDVTAYNVGSLTVYGRRGPSYPGGEVGMAFGHSFCNSGSVDIDWEDEIGGSMIDTYPKIAFLLARESNGRMVQVSGRSYLKHSRVPYNFNSGPCSPCTHNGGPFMSIGCSDTYSPSWNGNRIRLGPPSEINPFEGSFQTVGSYFDRGDPAVSGSGAGDNRNSLSSSMINSFDAVKNRVTVSETELSAAGAFYAQYQMIIKGEPMANRGDNLQHRPASFSWNGSSWNGSTNGGSAGGSVLASWSGATMDSSTNGTDDGRFIVAVKVTGPTNGLYHYEYAVHNIDNHRGGAVFRIPVDAGATVANAGVHDIDDNPSNDWVFAQNGTELTFSAGANNALDWNNLYNFWFDCSVAPGTGSVLIDQARPGAGMAQVAVTSEIPSGRPSARSELIGSACGDCDAAFYENFPSSGFDLSGTSIAMSYAAGGYTVNTGSASYAAPSGTTLTLSDDGEALVNLPFTMPYPGGTTSQLIVCSNGFISPAGSNGTAYTPASAAFLSGAPRWAAAWHDFNPSSAGAVRVDSSAAGVNVTWENVPSFGNSDQNTFQVQFAPNGDVNMVWVSVSMSGNGHLVGWSSGNAQDPGGLDLSALANSLSICGTGSIGLSIDSSARPVLGTTFSLDTTDIPSGSLAGATLVWFTQATPAIPLDLIGMEGCEMYGIGNNLNLPFSTANSSASFNIPVPNDPNLTGIQLIGESFTVTPGVTTLGVIASNGVLLTLGPQ